MTRKADKILSVLAEVDVAQAVVGGGMVLGIETLQGTDALRFCPKDGS